MATSSATPELPTKPTQDATPDPPTSSIHDATPTTASSKQTHKPFPSITGGCLCNTIRYRLLTSPLFVYACHCPDCQKLTGSAFSLQLNIEVSLIQILSPTKPVLGNFTKRPKAYTCARCRTELWTVGGEIADVRVGTLDFPGLMEPDVHGFVESKVDWMVFPEGTRTVPRGFEFRDVWPKSSLRRLDKCLAEAEGKKAVVKGTLEDGSKSGLEDGEKTPTAGEFGEDDEAFERRVRETEDGLRERLERLERKLEEEDKEEGGNHHGGNDHGEQDQKELERMTGCLDIREKSEVRGNGVGSAI
jgi:hypothetical protein